MTPLVGLHEVRLDDKGRVVVPAVHRSRYQRGAVLLVRGDHVAIYEVDNWIELVAKMVTQREAGLMTRQHFNWITTHAANALPDTAGRILVPTWMREHLGLDKDVVLGGHHEYLGIYPAGHAMVADVLLADESSGVLDRLGL